MGTISPYLYPYDHFTLSPSLIVINDNEQDPIKDQLLHPRSRYHGDFKPENLAFNANLQEFAQRVELICGLETGGKMSPTEAYDEIRLLWQSLKRSKAELLDTPKPAPPELPPDDVTD